MINFFVAPDNRPPAFECSSLISSVEFYVELAQKWNDLNFENAWRCVFDGTFNPVNALDDLNRYVYIQFNFKQNIN